MRLKLKTAPTIEPITLKEAKEHLRVDLDDDDFLITALIETARLLIEKRTGRALITQTWQLILDEDTEEIELPYPPLQSVSSVKYIKDDGTEATASSSLYDVDTSQNSPGRIKLKNGCSWPTHRDFASFIIEYVVGYGDAADDVPETLKQAILQTVAHLYENRESQEIPEGIHALIFPYRIFSL